MGDYLATSVAGWCPGNSWAGRLRCVRGGDVMASTPTQPPGCVLLNNGTRPSGFSPRSLSGPQSQVCFRWDQAVYSRGVWGWACVPPCLACNPQGSPTPPTLTPSSALLTAFTSFLGLKEALAQNPETHIGMTRSGSQSFMRASSSSDFSAASAWDPAHK